MAREFYYLISSLPMLTFGERPPLGSAEFLSSCRNSLDEGAWNRLSAVSVMPGGEPCCTVDRGWQAWETHLRNTLVTSRAGQLGLDPNPHRRPEQDVFPGDRRQVEEISGQANPLDRERALDRLRWQRLDDLAVGHEFDFNALVIYRLRLILLEKWATRTEDTGNTQCNTLIDACVEQAKKRRQHVEPQNTSTDDG